MILLSILDNKTRMKLIIIIMLTGYAYPCRNIAYRESTRPREIIPYAIIINMYFNHQSHIARKRWNKLMKITNGNQTKTLIIKRK